MRAATVRMQSSTRTAQRLPSTLLPPTGFICCTRHPSVCHTGPGGKLPSIFCSPNKHASFWTFLSKARFFFGHARSLATHCVVCAHTHVLFSCAPHIFCACTRMRIPIFYVDVFCFSLFLPSRLPPPPLPSHTPLSNLARHQTRYMCSQKKSIQT